MCRDAAPIEPCDSFRPDHPDPDGVALRFALPERGVDDDHEASAAAPAATAGRYGQAWSFAEISAIGSGHSIPIAGSS